MLVTAVRGWLLLSVLTLLALVVLAPQAEACPFCDGGPTGINEVRSRVFDDSFWPRAAATVAPFPILAGIVALIYFGPLRFPGTLRDCPTPGPPDLRLPSGLSN